MSYQTVLDPEIAAEVVAFLREWLPPEVRTVYRQMIEAAPDDWQVDPHFTEGGIVDQIFRGNGFTEKSLGVRSLDDVWPSLLRQAVGA